MRPPGSGAKKPLDIGGIENPARNLPDSAGGSWQERPLVASQIMPPLARSVWPLIQPSGPLARKAAAMFSDVPRRSSGFILAMRSTGSSDLPSRRDRWPSGRVRRRDGDAAATHFLGRDRGQGFHCRLGRSIDAIGFRLQAGDAGREVDDTPATAQAPCRLAQRVEGALEIDLDLSGKMGIIRVSQRREHYGAGVVHQHADPTIGGFGAVARYGRAPRLRTY